MQKNYLFKLARETKSGKTLVELHDPDTLENVQYWLDQGHTVDTVFSFKQKVTAKLTITSFNGRAAFQLLELKGA